MAVAGITNPRWLACVGPYQCNPDRDREGWLFPGQRPGKPMTTRQLNRLFHEAADAAGIKKGVTLHALRHNAESRIMPSTSSVALAQSAFIAGHSA